MLMETAAQRRQQWKLEHTKVRVDRIHIDGLERTKDDYIVGAFDDVFKVSTFEKLLEKTAEARLKLEKLGCFKNIDIIIDTSSGPKATPRFGYDITFNVVELSKIGGRTDIALENNQGSIGAEVHMPNLAGRGEILRSILKYNSKNMPTFNVSFMKPLSSVDGSLSSTILKQASENIASGYKLTEYGTQFALAVLYNGKYHHKLEYENMVRNIGMLNRSVAFNVREHAGYSLKSSIKNTISVDSRDSYVFPMSGSTLLLKSELAGLGGDVGFLKNELFCQVNKTLMADFTLQGSFGAGLIKDVLRDKNYSLIDRFFLGGPLTFRGFQLNSVGPMIDECAIGGSLYWASALHLYVPLPHRPKKGTFGDFFRVHIFANAGNLCNVTGSLKDCFECMKKDLRFTYGLGLVYRLGQLARIELNYCIPLYYQSGDKLTNSIQLGVGTQFM